MIAGPVSTSQSVLSFHMSAWSAEEVQFARSVSPSVQLVGFTVADKSRTSSVREVQDTRLVYLETLQYRRQDAQQATNVLYERQVVS